MPGRAGALSWPSRAAPARARCHGGESGHKGRILSFLLRGRQLPERVRSRVGAGKSVERIEGSRVVLQIAALVATAGVGAGVLAIAAAAER